MAHLILFIYICKQSLKNRGHKNKARIDDMLNWVRSVPAHQDQPVRGKFCFSLLDLIIRVGFMNNIYGTRMSAVRVMDYLDPQML